MGLGEAKPQLASADDPDADSAICKSRQGGSAAVGLGSSNTSQTCARQSQQVATGRALTVISCYGLCKVGAVENA